MRICSEKGHFIELKRKIKSICQSNFDRNCGHFTRCFTYNMRKNEREMKQFGVISCADWPIRSDKTRARTNILKIIAFIAHNSMLLSCDSTHHQSTADSKPSFSLLFQCLCSHCRRQRSHAFIRLSIALYFGSSTLSLHLRTSHEHTQVQTHATSETYVYDCIFLETRRSVENRTLYKIDV